MNILTVTGWSHAIKYHLYARDGWTLRACGVIERVDLGRSFFQQTVPGREPFSQEYDYSFAAVDFVPAVSLG